MAHTSLTSNWANYSLPIKVNTLLTITGPTACGKTRLAVELAYRLQGEIISADSRQVFRGMDIGSGKDLSEYDLHGVHIPYHLIDIHEAGYEYNVYQFQNDFITAYNQILANGRQPILCGGTGMYVESVVQGYHLSNAPINEEYRRTLEGYTDEELTERLSSYIKLHNHTDTDTRERLVRAIEIQEYQHSHPEDCVQIPKMKHVVIGIKFAREEVIQRIGIRLNERLESGMIEEVRGLLNSGVSPERLLRYGLEYRHVTRYLQGECSYEEMFEKLYTDIRRFAKRQMTWFRRMERNGIVIHWIDGTAPFEENVEEVLGLMENTR